MAMPGGSWRVAALVQLLKDKPWTIAVAIRFAQIPIAIKNYTFAAAGLRWRVFGVTCASVDTLSSFVHAYIGAQLGTLKEIFNGSRKPSTAEQVFTYLGLTVSLLVVRLKSTNLLVVYF
eukprot:SAG11_NODE_598_length_8269_cov_17.002448_4_plen_119_part_00